MNGLSLLNYLPNNEQEVIALFNQLLIQNIIKGYTLLYLSDKAVYDAGFEYIIDCNDGNIYPDDILGIGRMLVEELRDRAITTYRHRDHYAGRTICPELCVEFKYSIGKFLHEVINTPGRTPKDPNSIDLLIVWDEEIPDNIPADSFRLVPISDNQRIFHGTTHTLSLIDMDATDIPCILLIRVI